MKLFQAQTRKVFSALAVVVAITAFLAPAAAPATDVSSLSTTPPVKSPSHHSSQEMAAPPEVAQFAGDWPLPNMDYDNTRATFTSGINAGNVNDLGVAWMLPIPGIGPFGAATSNPIIQGGVVYFQDTASNIFAVDLESGEVIWEQIYDNTVYGPNGIAVGWGKVFGAKSLREVVALDKETGQELWTAQLEGPTGSFQPMIYNGMLFATDVAAGLPEDPNVGAEGIRFYEAGSAGLIYALDQETGEILWRFSTVEEGFWGNPDINSGGGVWFAPAIDTETGLTYFGTGNPAPFPGIVGYPNGISRPGDNLYTNSIVALDQDGQMVWYQQVIPHDLYDLDNQNSPILARTEIDGQQRDVVFGSGKHGIVIAYDRMSGEVLWERPVGRHLNDDVEEIPPDTVIEVYPGTLGGIEVPGAYADGVVYMPIVNLLALHHPTGFEAQSSWEAFENTIARGPSFDEGTGELVAIDARTGIVLWQRDLPAINIGAATVVNDLVFTATYDGIIYALDRETGEQVWAGQAPAGINGWPAVAGDTIVWPAGVGGEPTLIAYRLGAPGEVQRPGEEPPQEEPETRDPEQDGGPVDVEISAQGNQFSTDTITVPAGSHVVMRFVNNDRVPHNVAVYQTEAAQQSIFVGEIFGGPGERTYEFDAPSEPGTYFFRCDVHPVTMTGDFIVE